MAGDMHGRGHVWQRGSMHAEGGGMHGWGACMVRGACMVKGGVHGMHTHHPSTRYGRSMHGQYASYWNAFLLTHCFSLRSQSIPYKGKFTY